MRPLLVGVGSSFVRMGKFSDAFCPTPEGYRLWRMVYDVSGMSIDIYVERFVQSSLDDPDLDEKVAAAEVILPLGDVVWNHLRVVYDPLLPGKPRRLGWVSRGGKRYALVPPLSVRNLWYKDPDNRRKVGQFLSALVG